MQHTYRRLAIQLTLSSSCDLRARLTASKLGAVSSWGDQHSEVPILFARDPTKDLPENELAKKFLLMPDDAKSLPWRLLQRAKNRAKVWRIQATYNRAMVWNILYISLLCLYIGAIWLDAKKEEFASHIKAKNEESSTQDKTYKDKLVTQQSKYLNTMNGMDRVVEIEKFYRAFTSKKDDATFSVSYWYGFTEKPYVFVTTEPRHNHTNVEKDYTTIIGCGFAAPNHVIEGIQPGKVTAYDYNDNIVQLPEKCQIRNFSSTPIKAIVCATYNDKYNDENDPLITNRTVGICAFTEDSDNNIFKKEGRRFLITTIKQFHKDYINALENNNIISLDEAETYRKTLYTH